MSACSGYQRVLYADGRPLLAAHAELEEAEEDGEGEGERLGRVLRRSLSLNPATLAQGGFACAVETLCSRTSLTHLAHL